MFTRPCELPGAGPLVSAVGVAMARSAQPSPLKSITRVRFVFARRATVQPSFSSVTTGGVSPPLLLVPLPPELPVLLPPELLVLPELELLLEVDPLLLPPPPHAERKTTTSTVDNRAAGR